MFVFFLCVCIVPFVLEWTKCNMDFILCYIFHLQWNTLYLLAHYSNNDEKLCLSECIDESHIACHYACTQLHVCWCSKMRWILIKIKYAAYSWIFFYRHIEKKSIKRLNIRCTMTWMLRGKSSGFSIITHLFGSHIVYRFPILFKCIYMHFERESILKMTWFIIGSFW